MYEIIDQLTSFLDSQAEGAVIDVLGSDCLLIMTKNDLEDVVRLANAARSIHQGKVDTKGWTTQTGRHSSAEPNTSNYPKAATSEAVRERVWSFIRTRGSEGATCDEVEAALGLPHQSVSARVYDLEKQNVLVDSGQRRKTRSGRKARVLMTRVAFLTSTASNLR
jgi:hypothetical protein